MHLIGKVIWIHIIEREINTVFLLIWLLVLIICTPSFTATRTGKSYKCKSAKKTSVEPDVSRSDCKLQINFNFGKTKYWYWFIRGVSERYVSQSMRGPLCEQQFVDTLRGSAWYNYSHGIFFTYITLSWKHKYKQTFAIACSVIVTNPEQLIRVLILINFPLINTGDSIYVPWFRLTVIWYKICCRTYKQMQSNYSCSQSQGNSKSSSLTYKIKKHNSLRFW